MNVVLQKCSKCQKEALAPNDMHISYFIFLPVSRKLKPLKGMGWFLQIQNGGYDISWQSKYAYYNDYLYQ